MFEPPLGCKEPYEHTRNLPIPMAIDDYNHFMGGVDIADQLRAGFSTQQRGVKPWRPLFYWLLDSTTRGKTMASALLLAFGFYNYQCIYPFRAQKEGQIKGENRQRT
jgi:hypothetical protein